MTELSEVSDADVYRRYPILRFFQRGNPAKKLASVELWDMAWDMARNLPYCPETSTGLRKLLEANDCFVRASLPEEADD